MEVDVSSFDVSFIVLNEIYIYIYINTHTHRNDTQQQQATGQHIHNYNSIDVTTHIPTPEKVVPVSV